MQAGDVAAEQEKPSFSGTGLTVVLACDDSFAPYATVSVCSIVQNASPDQRYDLVILGDGVSRAHRESLQSLGSGHPNVSIRVVDAGRLLALHRDRLYTHGPWSAATYLRFFLPEFFQAHETLVYLDSDVVVLRDPAALARIHLGEHLLAAAPDLNMVRAYFDEYTHFTRGLTARAYLEQVLGLTVPAGHFPYINAGVLLFNLRHCREMHVSASLLHDAYEHRYKVCDQDVINKVCRGRILPLSLRWNWTPYTPHDGVLGEEIAAKMPLLYADWQCAAADPYIVHYYGFPKPWKQLDSPYADLWWQYARLSPCYGDLLRSPILLAELRKLPTLRRKNLTLLLRILFSWGDRRTELMNKRRDICRRIRCRETLRY